MQKYKQPMYMKDLMCKRSTDSNVMVGDDRGDRFLFRRAANC